MQSLDLRLGAHALSSEDIGPRRSSAVPEEPKRGSVDRGPASGLNKDAQRRGAEAIEFVDHGVSERNDSRGTEGRAFFGSPSSGRLLRESALLSSDPYKLAPSTLGSSGR